MTGMMFDVFPFINGSLNRRKILKELPSHVAKGVNDEIKKYLNGEYAKEDATKEVLNEIIKNNYSLYGSWCILTDCTGLGCDIFSNCRRCQKITRLIVKNYIKRTGKKKYLVLLKKKGENKR